jgi:putative transcriptional regulator
MSLLVASHLTFCPCCRDKLARLEALGGALLTEADAVPPEPRCLERALAAIARDVPAPAAERRDPPLPRPLCRLLPPSLPWQAVAPGLSAVWLDGFAPERVGLLHATPGVRIAPHGHPGLEGTLVLEGRMRDGGRTYGRGELAFADERIEHAPEAVGEAGCLCMVVQAAA